MDEIKKRLQETADKCLSCYEAWNKDQKDAPAREALIEAIHEIRKVASRLEIELAISERDEMAQKPIPIPPHRDAHRRSHDSDGDSRGNRSERSGAKKTSKPRRRPPNRKSADAAG